MLAAEFERLEKLSASARIFRSIALEMIEVTAMDLARKPPEYTDTSRGAHEARLTRETARRWVAGEYDCSAPMPFSMCCHALGVDEDTVRRALNSDPAGLQARLKSMAERDRGAIEPTSTPTKNIEEEIVTALQRCRNSVGAEKDRADIDLAQLTERHLTISLPGDWNGNLQMQTCIVRDGCVVAGASDDQTDAFYGVYAQQQDGTHHWLIDYADRTQALELVDRLTRIAARAAAVAPTLGWKSPETVPRQRFR